MLRIDSSNLEDRVEGLEVQGVTGIQLRDPLILLDEIPILELVDL